MHTFQGCLILAAAIFLGATPTFAQDRLGVVLMHGKQSAPAEHEELAAAIAGAGHAVDVPEMCWSAARIYDRPYPDCLREIDAAITRLKKRGATAFVIAGHSLGANGALGYGAANSGLKGIVALAPGHRPELLSRRREVAAGLIMARKLVAKGHGSKPHDFPDINGDLVVTVSATPLAYLSFMASDSPSLMPANAARLTAPLLYIVGTRDPLQRGQDEIFAKAPRYPLNRYVAVAAGHFDTSAASMDVFVAWLRELAAR